MRRKRKVQPMFRADQEMVTYLRELINEVRTHRNFEKGVEIGRHLARIKAKRPYGFTIWAKKKLGLTDMRMKVFMLMAQQPDVARESCSQAEFMRRIEPNNPRFRLIRKPKAKIKHKHDTWNVTALTRFYWDNYRSFPQELKTSFGLIPDVVRFFESYLEVIKNNNGNIKFKSYYDKLTEVKQILKKHG